MSMQHVRSSIVQEKEILAHITDGRAAFCIGKGMEDTEHDSCQGVLSCCSKLKMDVV